MPRSKNADSKSLHKNSEGSQIFDNINLESNNCNETDEDDNTVILNKNHDSVFEKSILPSDQELCNRSLAWAKLFDKFENTLKTNPGYYDEEGLLVLELSCIEDSEDDDKTDDFTSFEDNNIDDDSDFDIQETINETLPILEKRKENWYKQNNFDKTMDSFSSSKILEVSKWLDVNYNVDPSFNNFNFPNNDEDSSCCSLEMTQYIKKNSFPKTTSSKFNQRIKLNKMRNSLMLNKYCDSRLNFYNNFDKRSFGCSDRDFGSFQYPPQHHLTDDFEIYRRFSSIPEHDLLNYRNNRLLMCNAHLYDPRTLYRQHEFCNISKSPTRTRNFENENKCGNESCCSKYASFDGSFFNSTSYEDLAKNKHLQNRFLSTLGHNSAKQLNKFDQIKMSKHNYNSHISNALPVNNHGVFKYNNIPKTYSCEESGIHRLESGISSIKLKPKHADISNISLKSVQSKKSIRRTQRYSEILKERKALKNNKSITPQKVINNDSNSTKKKIFKKIINTGNDSSSSSNSEKISSQYNTPILNKKNKYGSNKSSSLEKTNNSLSSAKELRFSSGRHKTNVIEVSSSDISESEEEDDITSLINKYTPKKPDAKK